MMLAAPMNRSSSRFHRLPEILTACCALGALLAVEWYLSLVIPGASYSQRDGKGYQALLVTAFKFGGIFNLTNLNPVQGYGSLLLPMNVWANPAWWPFIIQDTQLATDISATLAVGCLAAGCYIMARCFDVPVLPSIIGAQLVIVMLPPLVRVTGTFYEMLWLNPGIATAYAAPMVALGIFTRLDTGIADKFAAKPLLLGSSIFSNPATKNFFYITGGVFASLLYGIFIDPLWIAITGIALFPAFAVVMLSELRFWPIVRRFSVLGCCLALLLASGALVYFYTLSQYTARVWWSNVLFYEPQKMPSLASITRIYPATLQHYYFPCAAGWLLGLIFARGRTRVLVCAALGSFILYVAQAAAYLRSSHWSMLPIPIYVEGAAMPLFTVAAVVGYWMTLRTVAAVIQSAWKKATAEMPTRLVETTSLAPTSTLLASCRRVIVAGAALAIAMVVPTGAAVTGVSIGAHWPPILVPFPDEPELLHYFEDAVGLRVDRDYRGIVWPSNAAVVKVDTIFDFWLHSVPTATEYSTTFPPVVMYLYSAVFQLPISSGWTNGINPHLGPDGSYDVFLKTLQALGVRYLMYTEHFPAADQKQFPVLVFPRPAPILEGGGASPEPPGDWIVYQLPEPNTGNYSPTRIVVVRTGAEIAAIMRDPNFDFKDQAILASDLSTPLVPASATKLSIIRDGLHFKAHSDGTSLVILPQQFSKCLSARDPRVRLVRADLVLTGVVFSGDIDTDISFDYGIFSPWCRLTDMNDTKLLDLKIVTAAH